MRALTFNRNAEGGILECTVTVLTLDRRSSSHVLVKVKCCGINGMAGRGGFDMVFDCVFSLDEKDKAYDYVGLISRNALLREQGYCVTIGAGTIDWIRAGLKRTLGVNLFKGGRELFWVTFPTSAPYLEELKNDIYRLPSKRKRAYL